MRDNTESNNGIDRQASRIDCANAIRALSMDAVRKPSPATQAPRWGWLILPKFFGMTI